VGGLQWKIGWLDPGLLTHSEIPVHIRRVLGAQEGNLEDDHVRCYDPVELSLRAYYPSKGVMSYTTDSSRSREVGTRQETLIIHTDHTFILERDRKPMCFVYTTLQSFHHSCERTLPMFEKKNNIENVRWLPASRFVPYSHPRQRPR
jgi:hypothetical protein